MYISVQQPIAASRDNDHKRTKTILVKNVPASADEELLEMFFESTKKQGRGSVNCVKIFRDKNVAFVEFCEHGAVETVIKQKNIKFGTTELHVEPYKPLLHGSGKINRVNFIGLPATFTDGLLKAQLDSLLSPQARTPSPYTGSGRKSKTPVASNHSLPAQAQLPRCGPKGKHWTSDVRGSLPPPYPPSHYKGPPPPSGQHRTYDNLPPPTQAQDPSRGPHVKPSTSDVIGILPPPPSRCKGPEVGFRVVRGKDWSDGNQDGGGEGTLTLIVYCSGLASMDYIPVYVT